MGLDGLLVPALAREQDERPEPASAQELDALQELDEVQEPDGRVGLVVREPAMQAQDVSAAQGGFPERDG